MDASAKGAMRGSSSSTVILPDVHSECRDAGKSMFLGAVRSLVSFCREAAPASLPVHKLMG